jgi:Thiamine pyrophosphate enzyme, C-terminal TPP binding domain
MTDVCPLRKCSLRLMKFDPQIWCLSRRAHQISAIFIRRGQSASPIPFYTFASRGPGWNLPASAGIALAEQDTGRARPVIAIIGDGSFQYSVQSIWSAAQLHLPMLIVVLRNDTASSNRFRSSSKRQVFPALSCPVSTSSPSREVMGAMPRALTTLTRSKRPPLPEKISTAGASGHSWD